ncbi:hypothetical protein GALMADRAFT_1131951 [Galerina marginata CBS 339.88]|uniref:Uncharacterized protein n=1 Tax=Galerina marginata (strain CBS 339.88) TaxID=685588 RepID=A0A067SJR7_GALM3|nr:hypothetical protein GALMADRAFT_1131951 [Galerina marginata CBS 339.88]
MPTILALLHHFSRPNQLRRFFQGVTGLMALPKKLILPHATRRRTGSLSTNWRNTSSYRKKFLTHANPSNGGLGGACSSLIFTALFVMSSQFLVLPLQLTVYSVSVKGAIRSL